MRHASLKVDMNFCHRCGTALHTQEMDHIFICDQGHTIYANASPAVAAILVRGADEILVMARAKMPGRGKLTLPGGFCNGAESIENGLQREIFEETKLSNDQYGPQQFVTSDIDVYIAENQRTPVSAVMFTARLDDAAEPQLDDENLWYKFVPLSGVNADDFYSLTVAKAVRMLQADPTLIP